MENNIKLFLGEWIPQDNGKMKRVVDPLKLKWFENEIKMAEGRGYIKCLKKRINELKLKV